MKNSAVICQLAALIVSVAIVVTFAALDGRGQEKSAAIPEQKPTPPILPDTRDLSKYGIVNYDVAEPPQTPEGDRRRQINQRYDRQGWVYKAPINPRAGGVGTVTGDPPRPLFPINESALIVLGKVIKADAFLSNDKTGVYTEYTILAKDVFKGTGSNTEDPNRIIADREGGVVVYPNGQRIHYQNVDIALPQLDSEYIFFLVKDNVSPNYSILTSYLFKENGRVYQMERGNRFDEFKNMNKTDFIEVVRTKIRNRNQ